MTFPAPLRFVAPRHAARAGSARVPRPSRARTPTLTAVLAMAFAILAVVATPAADDSAQPALDATTVAATASATAVTEGAAAASHGLPPVRAVVVGSLQQPIEVTVGALNAAGTLRVHTGGRWFLFLLVTLAALLAVVPRGIDQRWARVHAPAPTSAHPARAHPTRGPPVR